MSRGEPDSGAALDNRGTAGRTKAVDVSITIEAPPEAVWRAISDAEELQRWFPLSAAIEPGAGGTVTLAWGPDVAGTATIEVWEEGRHLRYVEGPAGGEGEAARVAVDYFIEGRGETTVLRVVSSGFSADDDWAEYIDTIDSGWRYFLFNLKHYLERHPGTPRRMVWERRKISIPKGEAWPLLFGPGGLVSTSLPASAGGAARLWSGHAAVVTMSTPPIHLACRCEELNDALLLVELEPGSGEYSLGVWLSLYGLAEEAARQLEGSLRDCLGRLV